MSDRVHVTFDETALSPSALNVLNALSGIGRGYGLEGSENKYWQRGAAELVKRGLAEETLGYFSLTEVGRDYMRGKNHD